MTEARRLIDRLYLATVIALLFLASLTNGYVAAAVAVALFVVGLVLYPSLRRTAILSGLVAAVVAVVVVALRTLL